MAGLERERVNEFSCAAVVIGPVTLVLFDLLAVGPCCGLAGGITRETVKATVDEEGLAPVLRGEEFKVESSIAFQLLGNRLVQIDDDFHGGSFACDHYPGVEIVVVITEGDLDGVLISLDLAVDRIGDEVPLFGGVVQADGTALNGADSVVDDLDTGVLFVIETSREGVAVDKDVHALPLEVLQVIDLQVRRR